MTFDEFEGLVFGWSADRKIIKNGKPYTQALKLSEEWGEVCRALAKDDEDELKDGIGDCYVLLVNLARMTTMCMLPAPHFLRGFKIKVTERKVVRSIHWLISELYQHFLPDDQIESERICIEAILDGLGFNLALLAQLKGLDYMDCCAHAWSEIKDRRGYLNELGVFVKEDANAQA